MKFENVYMGTLSSSWMSDKNIKYITFSVTDDCNLMCQYCYFTHKNNKNKLNFETAKKAIDYILSEKTFEVHDGVVWDFIGGEPTLEMDLIDEICDYILYRMYTLNHKWLYCYRFMIGTNGLLYSSEKMQNFIKKHGKNLHVNITVDGSKEKHDLSRIKRDGSGSYDDVVKNLPLWFEQIGVYSTKATFAHADIPYLKDSIINLWNLGFTNVMANVVFENVWEDGDDIIYEQQLKALADYVIDNKLWNKYSVRFFSPDIGFPVSDNTKKINFCGSGNMMAIDHKGDFYPCIRFMDSALNNKKGRIIGNINDGIYTDKIRAFNTLSYDAQSPEKCLKCDVAAGCSWCTGLNYDEASCNTVFERQTFLCQMHKANVRANNYFWNRYEDVTGNVSPLRINKYSNVSKDNKYLYILNNNKFSFCHVNSSLSEDCVISDELYKKAIEFCDKNNYIPVHVGFEKEYSFGYYIGDYRSDYARSQYTMDVIDSENIIKYNSINTSPSIIYKTGYNQLNGIIDDIKRIIDIGVVRKINLVIDNYYKWTSDDLITYNSVLKELSSIIYSNWKQENFIQINVITNNLLSDEKKFCDAGNKNFTMSPDGRIYPCSAYYFENKKPLGYIDETDLLDSHEFKNLLTCQRCDVNYCNKCAFLNEKLTEEQDAAFEVHCVKNNIELNIGCSLLKRIRDNNLNLPFSVYEKLREASCLDPLIDLRADTFASKKLYSIIDKL